MGEDLPGALNFSSLCSGFLECCSKAIHLCLAVAHCFQSPFQSRNSVFVWRRPLWNSDLGKASTLKSSTLVLRCAPPVLARHQDERRSSCAANASGSSACHFTLIHSLGSLPDDQPEAHIGGLKLPQRSTHKVHPTRTLREAIKTRHRSQVLPQREPIQPHRKFLSASTSGKSMAQPPRP